MSKIVRLPNHLAGIGDDRNNRPPAPPTIAPADEPRRPDPALLIRQAVLQATGKCSGIGIFAAPSTMNSIHVDDAILRTLSLLADEGCPTSLVVLCWITARQERRENGEGGVS